VATLDRPITSVIIAPISGATMPATRSSLDFFAVGLSGPSALERGCWHEATAAFRSRRYGMGETGHVSTHANSRTYDTTLAKMPKGKARVPAPFDPNEVWGFKGEHHVAGRIAGTAVRREPRSR